MSTVTDDRSAAAAPAPLPPAGQVHVEPQVETAGDRTAEATPAPLPATDPVCGMSVDPATAPEHRGTGPGTVYFCSAGCAAAFDADPGRYAATPSIPAVAGTQ